MRGSRGVCIDPKGDWWGVRSAPDGKRPGMSVPIIGGEHGDVPLDASSGHVVADLIVDERLTAVVDVSEFLRAELSRFGADFAERLYKKNREPLHVFAEEADQVIPQRVMHDAAPLRRGVVGAGAFGTDQRHRDHPDHLRTF